jgi:hypothetical protein
MKGDPLQVQNHHELKYPSLGPKSELFKNIFTTLTCQIIMQQILFIFLEKNTYTTLLGPTRLLISKIFS